MTWHKTYLCYERSVEGQVALDVEKSDQGKIWVDDLGWWTKKSSYYHEVSCWKFVLAGFKCFKCLVHFEVKDG